MATRSLGQLTLDLVARTGGFTGPLEKAQRSAKSGMTNIASTAKTASTAVLGIGTAAAGAATAMVAFTKNAADNARELNNQANLANASVEEFQRWSYATSTVGVEQDKLADILKDTTDRIGEFMSRGGGELQDFFEEIAPQVGVTAEQFRKLSGPEALQLYFSSIEKAGVGQQQLVSYMEQISDESAALIPLLRDNGAGLASLGEEADRLGIVLDEVDIAKLTDFANEFDRARQVAGSLANVVAGELAPYMSVLTDRLVDVAGGANGIREALPSALRDSVEALGPLLDGFQKFQVLDAQVQLGAGEMQLAFAEFAENAWSSLEWFLNTAIAGFNNLIRGINAIPGIDDIDLIGSFSESDFFARIQQQTDDATAAVAEYRKELEDAQNTPLMSGVIDDYLADVDVKLAEFRAQQDGKTLKPLNDWLFKPPSSISGGEESSAEKSVRKQVDALQQQAATLGMASEEQQLYALAAEGATEAQLAQARSALELISAHEEQEQAAEDYRSLVEALRTDEEALNHQMLERLATLDAIKLSTQEYQEMAGRIAGAAFEDAPEYEGLDASIGGAGGELGKIDEAQEELQEWYSTQLEMLENYRIERADLNAQWDEQERALKQKHEDELARIEKARQVAQLSAAESLFGDLADLTKTFAGEQSGIYRALFATEKAYSIASTLASSYTAIAKAWASAPFPANIPAVAAATVETGALTAAVEAVSLTGQAHDGLDSVRETGSYYLKKGERVTTGETSAKLDRTLDNVQSKMSESTSNGGGGLTIQAPVYVQAQPGMSDREARRQGTKAGEAFRAEVLKVIQNEKRPGGALY